jgi:hypothetical protein
VGRPKPPHTMVSVNLQYTRVSDQKAEMLRVAV